MWGNRSRGSASPEAAIQSRRLRRFIWVGILGFVVLAFALGSWGFARWRSLSEFGPDTIRAWDLAPEDTVYFYLAPNVLSLYQKFYKYHADSLRSPVLTAAGLMRESSTILNRPPQQQISPLLVNRIKDLSSVAPLDFFVALLPPKNGQKEFTFLSGGKCLSPRLSELWFRRKIELSETVQSRINLAQEQFTVYQVNTAGLGETYLVRRGDWILWATRRNALLLALRAIDGKNDSTSSLSQSHAFQRNRDTTLSQALMWVYADIRNVARTSTATGLPTLGSFINDRMSRLRAASWGWHSTGPGGPAHDLFAFTLNEQVIEAARRALPALSTFPVVVSDHELLSLARLNLDLNEMESWKVIDRKTFANGIKNGMTTPIETDSTPPPELRGEVRRQIQLTDNGLKSETLIEWNPEENPSVVDKVSQADWLTRAGFLPGATTPFFEMRINYLGIIKTVSRRAASAWPKWKPAVESRGLPMPASPPKIDFEKWFGSIRATAGFERDHLLIYNAFELKQSGSTRLTAMVTLAAILWEKALSQRLQRVDALFAVHTPDTEAHQSWHNLFDIGLISGLFVSPLYTNHHEGTMAVDLLALDYLATAAAPELRAGLQQNR